MPPFKLAVICGGPSLERGISLNSARSLLDHLQSPYLEILPLFVDFDKNFHSISTAQLYSNTPADFDYKLNRTGTALNLEETCAFLRNVDMVFPVIHGAFGEDGELQEMLERYHIPYVGSGSVCCKQLFRKHRAAAALGAHGFSTLPQLHFPNRSSDNFSSVEQFFRKHCLRRAIVKPAGGGSSIGVHSVSSPKDACRVIKEICENPLFNEAVLEPFCEGVEFTVVVLSNHEGRPVALIPTEIETGYDENQIFDYRKKYLPTNLAAYHTPPRFSFSIVDRIRSDAEKLFSLFEMRDFVRLDGWVMKDGTIVFTDINLLSGLEQNSFLFRQTCLSGMTHRESLEYIVKSACRRYNLSFPKYEDVPASSKKPVYVLFGSDNAERQVSLMSGTNVWLKLLQSDRFAPEPYLYDHKKRVWKLPYSYTLNHTVEEIYANCVSKSEQGAYWQTLLKTIEEKLNIPCGRLQEPTQMELTDFFGKAGRDQAFVFIGLHGGEGENGVMQEALEGHRLPFNGSNSQASALCMDKYLTGSVIQALGDSDLQSLPKVIFKVDRYARDSTSCEEFWTSCRRVLASDKVIVKPRYDGCSAGIVLLSSSRDLQLYCRLISENSLYIPAKTFASQECPIEMPSMDYGDFLLEPYIETDTILVRQGSLKHIFKHGWIELTVGVSEQDGVYRAFNPSITIAEGAVLTLEEKFQGGTGINLTPPPEDILPISSLNKIKSLVIKAARALGIENYARLDIFFNLSTEKTILIEANSLPGLTPSTVIYHQGLAEESPLTPLGFLESIIQGSLRKFTAING